MERRVLLAIFLAFLVLYVWQALFVKPVVKPGVPTAATPAGAAAPAGVPAGEVPIASSTPSTPPATAAAPPPPAAPPASAAAALVGEATERDIRVETREVIAVFTNRGARLKSWRLKRYLDQAKQPQELIEHSVSSQPLPFTLRTGTDAIDRTLNTSLYVVSGAPAATAHAAP